MLCENCGNTDTTEGGLCRACLRELSVSPDALAPLEKTPEERPGLGRVLAGGWREDGEVGDRARGRRAAKP